MKKHSFITILLTVLMSMVGAKAWAYDIEVDGISYKILQDNTLSVCWITVFDPEVVIPASVEYNGKKYRVTEIRSLGSNYSTETLIISNGVSTIQARAFDDCHDLTSITIPNSITYIGEEAFWGLSLSQLISEIENPFPTDNSSFAECSIAKLIVPNGTRAKYKATAGWKQFPTIVEVGEKSGKCGENVYYSYNSTTHTFTISGEGDMWNYDWIGDPDERPWLSYSKDIHSVIIVTMFADANDKVRQARHRSRGLRAPCREAPPRCFS